MNYEEARDVLRDHLQEYRRRSYTDLVQLLGLPQTGERVGPSGTTYQIEVEVFWDSDPGGNIRVQGAIDDKGWHALVPHCEDFILTPKGIFIGE